MLYEVITRGFIANGAEWHCETTSGEIFYQGQPAFCRVRRIQSTSSTHMTGNQKKILYAAAPLPVLMLVYFLWPSGAASIPTYQTKRGEFRNNFV